MSAASYGNRSEQVHVSLVGQYCSCTCLHQVLKETIPYMSFLLQKYNVC